MKDWKTYAIVALAAWAVYLTFRETNAIDRDCRRAVVCDHVTGALVGMSDADVDGEVAKTIANGLKPSQLRNLRKQ